MAKIEHDTRFSCVVCLMPSLEMVYGRCQHRVCSSCLYNADGSLKSYFEKCPLCLMSDTFARERPTIPDDNKLIQEMLGVRQCNQEGCRMYYWFNDTQEHQMTFHNHDRPNENDRPTATSSTQKQPNKSKRKTNNLGLQCRKQPRRKVKSRQTKRKT